MIPVRSTFTTSYKADPITLKEELAAGYPSYTVTYSVMADSFKLRNKNSRHTLLYNTDKPSKLESISLRMRRKVLTYNLVLCLVLASLGLGDQLFNNGKIFNALSSDNFLFLSILLLGLYQYVVYLLHPGLERDLRREHGEVRERIEQIYSGK